MKHVILLFVSVILTFNFTIAQDHSGFIYGTITTVDDDVYTGQIRWDDEEVYWFDFFNSEKKGNEYLRYLSRKDMEHLESRNDSWEGLFDLFRIESHNEDFNHIFECMFGNIKTMDFTGRRSVRLTFKNNRDIEWDEFEKLELKPEHQSAGPSYHNFGVPYRLEGTVELTNGTSLNGYIVYDLDETWDFEILQGEDDDMEFSIPFGYIKEIIPKNYNFCRIVMRDGKQLTLGESHDVTDDNYGILIAVNKEGYEYIPFEEVNKVIFK